MDPRIAFALIGSAGLLVFASVPANSAVTNFVTNATDSGPGSLRQAIAISASGDVIRFRTNGVVVLTSGELSITNNVSIVGPGALVFAISGNRSSRVFNIAAGATTSISGLTIRDGRTADGSSSNVVPIGIAGRPGTPGQTGENGGGIFNRGVLTLSGCILLNNLTGNGGNGGNGFAGGEGGQGGAGGAGGSGGHGGGIYNMGTARIIGCRFSGNSTGNGGAGGSGGDTGPPRPGCSWGSVCYGGWGLNGAGGSGGHGGAISHDEGTLWIVGSAFIGNTCGVGGSGGTSVWPQRVGILGSGGSGGGIANKNSLIVSNSIFQANHSGQGEIGGNGGAVFNQGALVLLESSFTSNSVSISGLLDDSGSKGGAICNTGVLTSVASTFSANSAGREGGAIYNTGSLDLRSCTLSGNLCNYGWYFGGGGGGLWSSSSHAVTISACTIVSNQTTLGEGAGILNRLGSTPCVIRNTLIAGNASGSSAPELNGPFESRGNNLVGTRNSGLVTVAGADLIGSVDEPINPVIGPLQDNGGPVFTHALLAGSPAIDAGINTGDAFDARGQPRTVDNLAISNALTGDGTDIGALEVNHILTGTEVRIQGDDVLVRFTSVSDKTYGVEYRSESTTGAWVRLSGTVTGTGGFATYIDFNAASQPRRFYRIFEHF